MNLKQQLDKADEQVRVAMREHERLDKLWRREWQADEMTKEGRGTPDNPVRWLGDIGSFCDDLDYHTIRTGKAIHAQFNGIRIVTNPHLKENAIALDAFNQWREGLKK